jgi:hypothetical protein
MNHFVLAPILFVLIAVAAVGLVNTEAGTFRCSGSIVSLDRHGVPSSGEPGGQMKPCVPIVEVGETI